MSRRSQMGDDDRSSLDTGGRGERLRALTQQQVAVIDRALASIGAFGEVRIVKAKGRVRFIETLESRDLLKVGRAGWED